MQAHTFRWLDILFGPGDDNFPYWLMAVRCNILVLIACVIGVIWGARRTLYTRERSTLIALAAITLIAASARYVAASNLLDFGGIPFSRLLLGYKGHFATAQVYSLVYELSNRDIENAIRLNRVVGTLTIPLLFILCTHIQRGVFPAVSAMLLATYPVHILFSASDVLTVFSLFLTTGSFTLLLAADEEQIPLRQARYRYAGAFAAFSLLTQVRYENVLFLPIAALVLVARRHRVRMQALLPPAAIGTILILAYTYWALTSELSFQNPFHFPTARIMVEESVLYNSFLSVPLLLVASVASALSARRTRGSWYGYLALAIWIPALGLPLLAESGHGAARVFASWLTLLLPLAGFSLTQMINGKPFLGRAIAFSILVYLLIQPLVTVDRLNAQHLEIRESDFFKTALTQLPPTIDKVIVPDDELLRRRTHSTMELRNKYSMTLVGMWMDGQFGDPHLARIPRLVGLTEFLEKPQRQQCTGGTCAFFWGLPCMDQDVYPFTRSQCEALRKRFATTPLLSSESTASSFVHCSIYRGRLYDKKCAPKAIEKSFAIYQLSGEL